MAIAYYLHMLIISRSDEIMIDGGAKALNDSIICHSPIEDYVGIRLG
jgi:hypothetical protein